MRVVLVIFCAVLVFAGCLVRPEDGDKALFEVNGISEQERLIVRIDSNGVRKIWSESQRKNLTYCVSNNFLDKKAKVKTALETASMDWEEASLGEVDFIYSEEGDTCSNSNTDVLFNVRLGTYTDSFFPGDARLDREITISTADVNRDDFSSIPRLSGILRHELGHALGFGHEHFRRPDHGEGYMEDWGDEYEAVTDYDAGSVMHYIYPGYNDWLNPYWELTSLDVDGIQKVYPAPVPPPDPCDPRPCYPDSCLPEGHCLEYCE